MSDRHNSTNGPVTTVAVETGPKLVPDAVLAERPQGHGFTFERAAIAAARAALGGKAKKGQSFVTYFENGRWGWLNASNQELKTALLSREPGGLRAKLG